MMGKPRVFVTRRILPAGMEMISEACEMDLWPEDLPPSRSEMLKRVEGVAGILCMLSDRIDEALMDAAGTNLKVISNYAVGFDNIDINAAVSRRIAVGNTPGVLTDATADLAFALMLAAARRIVEADRYVRQGNWKTWGPSILLGTSLLGATLGLVGYGRIGQAVARRAAGFDMKILYNNRTQPDASQSVAGTWTDLDTLLQKADFISVHVPLTTETRHLINTRSFELMKPNAILINTARGAVVDREALYYALKHHRIFAAALDVTDPEPLPMDSPLLTLENLTIVPHIGSGNVATREKMSVMAAENLIAGLKGERLPNCVNPQIYK
jgi:glyoxylate reductase